MIINGKPELGLQKHQQDAYNSVKKAYEIGDRTAVVIPTGCGKSFVALQLMADNKDKRILFMAPTNAIKSQMYNYIAKYIVGEKPSKERPAKMIADEYFPNLKIMLYQSLLRVKDEQMEKLNTDIIIMDEIHRTGAEKWEERINTLLEKNPNSKILGLTATPDRMDDKNIVDELFEGKISYELTLLDALRKGIVKAPLYVKCDYSLGEHLEGIRKAIANCDDLKNKIDLQKKYDRMRKIVELADGIPELFEKNLKKKNGKYIVFCKDKQHMDEVIEQSKKWFENIDKNPEIYSVYSGDGYSEKSNKKAIKSFENSRSKHLKLLFSVDMLNEGLHVEDISGVIMLRPTDSRIVYLQQLGRALSSDTSREKTIVFDLVNNYLKNNLYNEITNDDKDIIKNRKKYNISSNDSNEEKYMEYMERFRIQGETKEFIDLLEASQEIISRSRRKDYLASAKMIKKWIDESGSTKPPVGISKNEEERRLGRELWDIRQRLIKPYMSLTIEDSRKKFREKYPEIDEVVEIVKEIDENNIPLKLKQAKKIKEWIEKSGDTKPPSLSSKNEEEKKLGHAYKRIKRYLIKPYTSLTTEELKEKFREKHSEIDEVMKIIKEIDENYVPVKLKDARKIKEWIEKSGDTKLPSVRSKNEEEKKLGNALDRIRQYLLKPYMTLTTEEEKEDFRKKHPEINEVMKIVKEIDENNVPVKLKDARKIKEWIEKSENAKFPSTGSKNEEEKRLGNALGNIRQYLIKPYMRFETDGEKEKFKEKHPEVDEVLDIISKLDMQCGNEKQRKLAILIRQDIERKDTIKKAKKLEQDYQQQLEVKKGKKIEDVQRQGVDFNE